MEIEFDPVKDTANVQKHGISLSRAVELEVLAFVDDRGRYEEPRYRLYGMIAGEPYCLAAVDRGSTVRAISLRRAHRREMERYVEQTDL